MRTASLSVPLELKNISDREFDGYGSVFGNVDLGGDIVLPGAFKRSLAEWRERSDLPAMFWMHDPSRVPGKWLSMSEDDDGLSVKGVLAPTDLGNEIHALLRMEAVRGMSIGYRTREHDWDKSGNRLIKEAELWEVSVVSLPMNPLARVQHVKSRLSERGEYVPTIREFEKSLRSAGLSRDVAKRLIAKVYEDEERDVPTRSRSDSHREGGQTEMAIAEKLAEQLFLATVERRIPHFR